MSGKNNVPGPEFGLNEIINVYTEQVIVEREASYKYNPLRPSSAGKCTRELGYEFAEFRKYQEYPKEPKTPEVHRLLNLGDKIEWHANEEMKAAFAVMPKPPQIKYKQHTLAFFKFPDGTFLEGKLDLCVEIDGDLIVCDWKSKSDKYSAFYKSAWDEFPSKLVATGFAQTFGSDAVFITDLKAYLAKSEDPFFNNNLYQLNFYACNPFLKERGCKLASVLQYNKNDSRIREVRFVPSQEVFEETQAKFQVVMAVVDGDKTPENLSRDFVLGSMKCGFCSYKKHCWPEDDALKEYFKTLPPKAWPKDLDRLSKDLQERLIPLFAKYQELSQAAAGVEPVEQEICRLLNAAKVFKVRLDKDHIYRVKRLKEGLVLRRDKL